MKLYLLAFSLVLVVSFSVAQDNFGKVRVASCIMESMKEKGYFACQQIFDYTGGHQLHMLLDHCSTKAKKDVPCPPHWKRGNCIEEIEGRYWLGFPGVFQRATFYYHLDGEEKLKLKEDILIKKCKESGEGFKWITDPPVP